MSRTVWEQALEEEEMSNGSKDPRHFSLKVVEKVKKSPEESLKRYEQPEKVAKVSRLGRKRKTN